MYYDTATTDTGNTAVSFPEARLAQIAATKHSESGTCIRPEMYY